MLLEYFNRSAKVSLLEIIFTMEIKSPRWMLDHEGLKSISRTNCAVALNVSRSSVLLGQFYFHPKMSVIKSTDVNGNF